MRRITGPARMAIAAAALALCAAAAAMLAGRPAPRPAIVGDVEVDRTSRRVIYASRAGVPAIASLSSPQSGPDGTAALQAIFNLNGTGGAYSGQALEVVIDIPVLCANVSLNSYTTLRGIGSYYGYTGTPPAGLFMKAVPASGTGSTNSCILKNAHWASNYGASTPNCANIVDQDIRIRDLYLDGQRRNNISGSGSSYPNQNPNYQFISPIQFYGVSDLGVSNVNVYDQPAFAVHVANVNRGTFRDVYVTDPVTLATPTASHGGTDGIHLNGPCTSILVDGLYGTTGDDFLAITPVDGNLATGSGYTPGPQSYGGLATVYCGNITNVTARNLHGINARNVARILTGTDSRSGGITAAASNILIDGVVGTFGGGLTGYSESYTGSTGVKSAITLRNWAWTPIASTYQNGLELGGTWQDLVIDGWQGGDILSGSSAHALVTDSDFTCTSLTFLDRSIVEDSSEVASPGSPIAITAGTIDSLNLIGCRWLRTANTSAAFVAVSGGTVNRISLSGCQFNNINNAISATGGTVGGIESAGLVHRNANGNPSINVGTGVTVPRLRASGSDTAALVGTPAGTISSKKTDGTEDAT